MPTFNRNTLRNFFKKGSFPTEANFWDLIDSTINKIDDGFDKSSEDGMQISTLGKSKNLMSFYEDAGTEKAAWKLQVNPEEGNKGFGISDAENNPRLYIDADKGIGIGTTNPDTALTVNGGASMVYRIGGFKRGRVLADKQWHAVVDNLKGYNVLEITAQVGSYSERGKYAVAHCMAVNAFGRGKVRTTQSSRGFLWNKLRFRWRGTPDNYRLEVKSMVHFPDAEGQLKYLQFHVTQLWQNEFNFEKFYPQQDGSEDVNLPG
jgi:hypothetical protein